MKKLKYVIALLTLILSSVQVFSQDEYYKQVAGYNRVIIPTKDSVIYAWFYRNDDGNEINANEDKYYYWFAQNDIKKTRGGYDGKLLHGDYIVYYPNKDLCTKGLFKYGLKTGSWKSWYQGGEIKSKEKWRKGEIIGTAYFYLPNGKIQSVRKSLDHKGSAIVWDYNEQGKLLSKKYYKKNFLIKEKTYQINGKGKSIEIKPEKVKKVKASKEKKVKEGKASNTKEKKAKEKKTKSPKIKVQKFRQVVPGGEGA
ncbi:MAG TPA: hypothetical protein VK796_05575 [Cytophaga sp.]|nr:hypothetical protein [Cytophaga sp.]